jgi:hypothetical protein
VVVISQNTEGRLLERAVRKVVGRRIPVHGAMMGRGWDLAAKGAALRHWKEKSRNCELQVEDRLLRDEIENEILAEGRMKLDEDILRSIQREEL